MTAVLGILLFLLQTDPLAAGAAAWNRGDKAGAVAQFRRAHQANPSSVPAMMHLAHALARPIYTDKVADVESRAQEAIRLYESVLAADPNNTLALWNLAVMTYITRPVAARDLTVYILKADVRHADAYYLYALDAYLDMSKRTEALMKDDALRRKETPQHLLIVESAIGSLQRALEVDHNFRDAMVVMTLLLRDKARYLSTAEAAPVLKRADEFVEYVKEIDQTTKPALPQPVTLDAAKLPPPLPRPPAPK